MISSRTRSPPRRRERKDRRIDALSDTGAALIRSGADQRRREREEVEEEE
jgi:hypothetical protein